jgi:hypothetical protein
VVGAGNLAQRATASRDLDEDASKEVVTRRFDLDARFYGPTFKV